MRFYSVVEACVHFLQIPQKTVNRDGKETELRARGRHDPCVVPRGEYMTLFETCELDRFVLVLHGRYINGNPHPMLVEMFSFLAAVPMVEAMVALVLADQLMLQVAQCQTLPSEMLEDAAPLHLSGLRAPTAAEQAQMYSEQ